MDKGRVLNAAPAGFIDSGKGSQSVTSSGGDTASPLQHRVKVVFVTGQSKKYTVDGASEDDRWSIGSPQ